MSFTVSRLGQINTSGSATALFFRKFGLQVLAAFSAKNIMKGLHRNSSISSGKSISFPVSGTATSGYYVVGEEIDGQQIAVNEKTINVDMPLLASVRIADYDRLLTDYQFQSQKSDELGIKLANDYDKKALQVAVLTARISTPTVTNGPIGTQISTAGNDTDADVLKNSIIKIAQTFDEKNVPEEGRVFVVRPAQYYLLLNDTDVINKDWDGDGSLSKGKVGELAGVTILKSNNLPSTVINSQTGENNTYSGDFTKTVGVAFTPDALGTVWLQDIMFEQERSVAKQSTLIVAKYVAGTAPLRPECAIEVKTP